MREPDGVSSVMRTSPGERAIVHFGAKGVSTMSASMWMHPRLPYSLLQCSLTELDHGT
jgi:hypothetical protein